MNNITVLGRLTKEPELKKTTNNKNYIYFTLAARQGKDKTNFIPCIAFSNLAETIAKYCKKGTRIFVDGYLETIFGDKGNNNVVKVRHLEFADQKLTADTETEDDISFTVNESFEIEDITDDLPF